MPHPAHAIPEQPTKAKPFAVLDRWWWVLLIPGAMTLYRVLFLTFVSRLGLSEDEAQYWDWSRYLDWGYFTKPGGVAWSIAASTSVFGDTEFAVRLPAVLAGFVGSLAVGLLARDMFKDWRLAALSCIAYLCVPAFAMLGFLMTIDGPVMAAWAVAAWGGHRAMVMNGRHAHSARGWVWLGLAVAVGLQFKPTMLLVVPGVVVFRVWAWRAHPADRDVEPSRSGWPVALALLIVLIGFVPTLIYNAQHGWTQVIHLLDHVGIQLGEHPVGAAPEPQGRAWDYRWTLEYPLVQLATAGSVGVLAIIAALRLLRRTDKAQSTPHDANETERRSSVAWCVCLAVPLLLFYLLVSFFTRVEGNWPIGAWVTACPLAAWAVFRGFESADRGLKIGAWVSAGFGVLVPALLLAVPLLHGRGSISKVLPTHRLMGFGEIAAQVELGRERAREQTGLEPFMMTVSYGRAALLEFYLEGEPEVFCAARYNPSGGSGRQYDVWAHTDLERASVRESLLGRPGVMIRRDETYWERGFVSVERLGEVQYKPTKAYGIFLGLEYTGFETGTD
ncbi:MAG: 4-amino-4-deoxy-L-arabinose transferase-like glycosyltransferase [Phycisphaerales bacterium]|jgi:4-amino-4-deoxy-L-arabinose transferase-like glycosyltransferase